MAYTPGASTHNPLGAVNVFDNENPCIFTARVIATVSGGQFVMCSGTLGTSVTGSSIAGYTVSDLNVCPSDTDLTNGIALYNVASGTNNYVAIARKGVYLLYAGGPCSGACSVFCSSGGVASATVGSSNIIGRSFNAIDEGRLGMVALNC